MYIIFLGLVNSNISVLYQLATLLDIKKELNPSTEKSMKTLAKSRVDFTLIEILTNFRTTG